MSNKIYDFISQLPNASDYETALDYLSTIDETSIWKQLIKESPFLIFHPDETGAYSTFQKLIGPMKQFLIGRSDRLGISIFNADTSSSSAEYQFLIFTTFDEQNNKISIVDEYGNVSEIDYESFQSYYSGYKYYFSFVLNDFEIFPLFTIDRFENEQTSVPLSLNDIFSYIYWNYDKNTINLNSNMLNIIGIRSDYGYDYSKSLYKKRGVYADYLLLFYVEDGNFVLIDYVYTSFPDGRSKKQFPDKTKRDKKDLGTAVIMPGFHCNVYKIGTHRGYEAIQQMRKIPIFRDPTVYTDKYHNLTVAADFDKDRYGEDTLPFVNIHTHSKRVSEGSEKSTGLITTSKKFGDTVDGNSAGCQVVALDKSNGGRRWFDEVMPIFKRQKEKNGTSEFDYLLIEAVDFFNFMSNP
jgi:hypothetical protein